MVSNDSPRAASGPALGRARAHAIRSPLTAIIGFAESLSREARRGPIAQDRLLDRLSRIRTAAERIDELLDEAPAR